jgi:hypothetical protein
VAAVSVAGNLTFVVLAATQMVAVGTTSLVAQATGRKDGEGARLIFNQSQGLSLAVGALFFLVFWAVRVPYARAQTADAPPPASPSSTWTGSSRPWPCNSPSPPPRPGCAAPETSRPGMVVQTVTWC